MKNLNEVLAKLAEGKRRCIINIPDYGKNVEAEITKIDLVRDTFAIEVKFITELSKTTKELVELEGFARLAGDTKLIEVTKPYKRDWICLEYIIEMI
jgi:hypothetical protein